MDRQQVFEGDGREDRQRELHEDDVAGRRAHGADDRDVTEHPGEAAVAPEREHQHDGREHRRPRDQRPSSGSAGRRIQTHTSPTGSIAPE